MSYYEQFQLNTYGNILPADKDHPEEYEYLNMENREFSEWLQKEEEQQFEQQTTK